MVHSTNEARQGYLSQAGYGDHPGVSNYIGENLAWTSASQSSSDGGSTWTRSTQIKNGREVSGMWASEKQWYDMGAQGDDCIKNTACHAAESADPSQVCQVGHYTAQIWHSTTHVGCGVSQCNDHSVLWVCQYYPGGNTVGQLPFCKQNKPSDMGACSDLSSQSDPSGLTCTAGRWRCSRPCYYFDCSGVRKFDMHTGGTLGRNWKLRIERDHLFDCERCHHLWQRRSRSDH